MHISVHFRCLAVKLVVFHELAAGLLVERRFGERHYQKALDYFQNVEQTPLGGVPVLL